MNIKSILTTLFVAISVFTSCTKEEIITPSPVKKVTVVKVVTTSNGDGSYNDEYYIKPARNYTVQVVSNNPTIDVSKSKLTVNREFAVYTAYRKGKNTVNEVMFNYNGDMSKYMYTPNDAN